MPLEASTSMEENGDDDDDDEGMEVRMGFSSKAGLWSGLSFAASGKILRAAKLNASACTTRCRRQCGLSLQTGH